MKYTEILLVDTDKMHLFVSEMHTCVSFDEAEQCKINKKYRY